MAKILLIANTDWYLFRFRLSLARFLRDQGMDVILISPPGPFVHELEADGFRWQAWNVGRQSINPFREVKTLLNLLRIVGQEKPDLIHLHTIKPVLYGSLVAILTRVPAVVRSITGRGYVFLGNDTRTLWLRPLVKSLYRFVLRSGSTLFENEADRQYFVSEKLVAFKNTHLIEGVGADTEYYQPLPEPQSADARPVVLMATRMLWDKGVGTLVDSARLLHQKMDARIVLAGEPDPGNPASIDVKILNQWVDEGLVEWWGWQADMRAAFAACHVVTLPSFGEGIPTVLLEAAACGRPIVTTDVPGCRDVVQDGVNGLLVPPRDSQALAAALLTLLGNESLRSQMGRAGRQLIVERFSNQHVHKNTLTVYRQLLPEE
ncbi:MAG: glycosyltransferase family 4 protein [Anaerolineales bacterium]|uniref:glycosyltransferase family 4 protein n=1 Tax=Candidatus Villigracilis proximus TaxID=3140683 RepID=UPI003136F2D9|nr:glycosyltransferase family 4 protein [Anaerolineales bacterium]